MLRGITDHTSVSTRAFFTCKKFLKTTQWNEKKNSFSKEKVAKSQCCLTGTKGTMASNERDWSF